MLGSTWLLNQIHIFRFCPNLFHIVRSGAAHKSTRFVTKTMLTLSKSLRPANPVQGVKESKLRFKSAREELPELSRSYLEIRNQQMRTKNLTAEMELAERRGELIERSWSNGKLRICSWQ